MWWILGTVILLLAIVWLRQRLSEPGPARPAAAAAPPEPPPDLAYDLEIGDELDLHGVPPQEVAELVDAFVDAGVRSRRPILRIVHGRGIGALRATVRARLARHPRVRACRDAPPPSGWGATLVDLDLDSPPAGAGAGDPDVAADPT